MNRLFEKLSAGYVAFVMSLLILLPAAAGAESTAGTYSAETKTWTSSFFSPKVGNLYFLGGAGFFDLDGLNDSLSDSNYTELKSPALSLGFGSDMSIGRLILGGEWHWMKNVATESSRDDIRADISSKYWLFRVGVDLVKWRGLRIYPLLGIGASHSRFYIAQEGGQSFDDVLDNPNREVRMSQTGLLLDASLGIDYRFKMRENEHKASFFTLGVRGGYLFSPYSGSWETATADISGGPDTLANGPTVQLLIGFSGERKGAYHHRCGACNSGK